MRKKSLELQIRQPAPVRLANTSIAFRGGSTNPEYAPVVGSLLATLGTELISNEKTLVEKEKPADAAWVLSMTVTGFSVAQPSRRTEASGNTTMTYVRWNGSLNIAYQILDHAGHAHDAGNVAATYDREFSSSAVGAQSKAWNIPGLGARHPKEGENVPTSVEDVKQDLIKDVVRKVAAKLGNTTESVEVQVAGGETHLDRAAEFLDQRLWSRALDELEKTPAFPKPEQEAYRQYDLGLAYEAMSYSSTNSDDQKENIFKAAEYYDKALEMNEKEKYFVVTVARTRDALARYKDLEQMARKDKKLVPPSIPEAERTDDAKASTRKRDEAAQSGKPLDASPSSGKPISVSDVVDMVTGQVPEAQIIEVIQNSAVDFNPHDKDTVILIAKTKLSVHLQNALRAKVGAPLLPVAPRRVALTKPQ